MCRCLEVLDVSDSHHGHFAKQTRYYHVLHRYGHCAASEDKNSVLTKKYYVAVNIHASQSKVKDILRLTLTSNAANTCVQLYDYLATILLLACADK